MNDAGVCWHDSAALAVEPDQCKALRANSASIYGRLSFADLRGALHRLHLIRRFEENAEDAYMRGLVRGTMRLPISQEASVKRTQLRCRVYEAVKRLGGAGCPIPYNPGLEKACVPQTEAILAAARELADGRI